MNVDWSVDSVDGMALVTVELHNPTPVDRRVRVENELAGDVLPPRRQGVPERGWDETGYAGVVAADDRVSLGYACPAPVERPPVTVDDEGRVDERDDDPTAESAIRELGDPSPPADAVPASTGGFGPADGDDAATGDTGDESAAARDAADATDGPDGTDDADACDGRAGTNDAGDDEVDADDAEFDAGDDEVDADDAEFDASANGSDESGSAAPDAPTDTADPGSSADVGPAPESVPGEATLEATTADAEAPGQPTDDGAADRDRSTAGDGAAVDAPRRDWSVEDDDATPPGTVATWFDAVERRVERGEGLTDASVVDAADVLESAGGLDAVASLPESLAADAAALRAVAAEAERLADRAEATDVPVDALRRLA